jgi:hypothetical protein
VQSGFIAKRNATKKDLSEYIGHLIQQIALFGLLSAKEEQRW